MSERGSRELDRPPVAVRGDVEEPGEALGVGAHPGRQPHQHRPEGGAQELHPAEERRQPLAASSSRFMWVPQRLSLTANTKPGGTRAAHRSA